MLKTFGLDCQLATVRPSAIAQAAGGHWDPILMDFQLPGITGPEITRQIRSFPGEAAQPTIIALTANAMPEDLEICLAAGMNDVLTKPLKKAELADNWKNGCLGSRRKGPKLRTDLHLERHFERRILPLVM